MNTRRITWIDVAKGITIITMIVGHIVPFGSSLRNLIFSFHMPLFFILSGMTIKVPVSVGELFTFVKKDFKHIIIPCILTQLICMVLTVFFLHKNMLDMVKITMDQLFWAAAVSYKMHPGLGALWFLVVLFWSKVLFYVIKYYFTLKYHYIFLISVFVGASISRKFWLPQSFDLVLVTVGFVYIGWLLKEKKILFEKYQPIITYVAFVIWILCWQKGIYIELGTRSYPYFIVCIVEAFAGCICIFSFSKFLDRYSNLVEPLKIIGLNTLTILCVHHIDYFVPGIGQGSLLEICLRRILFDISFSLLFALLVKKTKIGFSS